MICPRCNTKQLKYSSDGSLVPYYDAKYCLKCAYPFSGYFNTIDYMDSIFYSLYKSLEPYLSNRENTLEPLNETMLKKLIDIALEENDEEEFMRLTKELKNLKSHER